MSVLIDIRENFEYKNGHIPNSLNINKDLLELVPEKYLNKNNEYILYCDYGITSKQLSNKLNEKGYRTKSLKGGYDYFIKNNTNL